MLNDPNHYNTGSNSYKAFQKMKPEDQERLKSLIGKYLAPVKTRSSKRTSYGLKHVFERLMPSGYISNGEMKGALLECGYKAYNTEDINWTFNISKKSPIFIISDYMRYAYGLSFEEVEQYIDQRLSAKYVK